MMSTWRRRSTKSRGRRRGRVKSSDTGEGMILHAWDQFELWPWLRKTRVGPRVAEEAGFEEGEQRWPGRQ